MKAIVLVKHGNPEEAFEIRELPTPQPKAREVLIEVEAFGLNFADVMARLGHYKDAPPLPSVIGYEAVGRVIEIGANITDIQKGQRVLAFTRFGAYATYVATDRQGVVPITDDMDAGEAVALATQYSTAYYAAEELVKLHKGDHVWIQAAAGGVGTALVQMAKEHGCIIYGAAGSDEKLKYLEEQGVHHPINYRKEDFYEAATKIMGDRKPDVIFNSLGGKTVRQGVKKLGAGGRIICYGNAEVTSKKNNVFTLLGLAIDFGFVFIPFLLRGSKALIGLYMLPIADQRPDILQRCLTGVMEKYKAGVYKPVTGGEYTVDGINEAHRFLESRKSMGKLVVRW